MHVLDCNLEGQPSDQWTNFEDRMLTPTMEAQVTGLLNVIAKATKRVSSAVSALLLEANTSSRAPGAPLEINPVTVGCTESTYGDVAERGGSNLRRGDVGTRF